MSNPLSDRAADLLDRAGWTFPALAVLAGVAGILWGLWMFLSETADRVLIDRARVLESQVRVLEDTLAVERARGEGCVQLEQSVIELGVLELEWVGAPVPPRLDRNVSRREPGPDSAWRKGK